MNYFRLRSGRKKIYKALSSHFVYENHMRRVTDDEETVQDEMIAGKHPVLEALRSGREINKIWIADGAQKTLTQPIVAEAKKFGYRRAVCG